MLRSDQLMNDLEVEGEFVTEKVMREEWGWTELLSNHKIIAELIFFKSHAHTHTDSHSPSAGGLQDEDQGCDGRLPEIAQNYDEAAVGDLGI